VGMRVGAVVGGTAVGAPLHALMKANMSSVPIQQRWLAKIFLTVISVFPPLLFGQPPRFHPSGCHHSGIHLRVPKLGSQLTPAPCSMPGTDSMASAILSRSSCELYLSLPKKQAPSTSAAKGALFVPCSLVVFGDQGQVDVVTSAQRRGEL
jgi:hypothetical protein